MESLKSSKLHSSVPKHFFCAESNEERDDWVTALIEFTEDASESIENSPQQPQYHQQQQYDRSSAYDSLSTPSTRYDHTNDDLKPNSLNIFATPASIAASVADLLSTYTMGVVGGEDQSQKQKQEEEVISHLEQRLIHLMMNQKINTVNIVIQIIIIIFCCQIQE